MPSVWTKAVPRDRLDWHAIKDQIDLAAVATDLLGEPPGRGGRGLWWVCPLHADRNPSFTVDPTRRRWKCFGCGERGDAAELAMRLNPGMAFGEAVRLVAELAGVIPSLGTARPTITMRPTRSPTRPPDRPSGLPHADAVVLVEESARRLWEPVGTRTLEYLRGRGLTDETIRRARLGFVAGASVPTRGGDRCYRASGIVIPWFDRERLALAKIRQLGDRKPKYVEAYRDAPGVYPSLAGVRPGRPLVIVEGEFDCPVARSRAWRPGVRRHLGECGFSARCRRSGGGALGLALVHGPRRR